MECALLVSKILPINRIAQKWRLPPVPVLALRTAIIVLFWTLIRDSHLWKMQPLWLNGIRWFGITDCVFTFCLSFIRFRVAWIWNSVFVITVPAVFWIILDTHLGRFIWWEFVVAFLLVQMWPGYLFAIWLLFSTAACEYYRVPSELHTRNRDRVFRNQMVAGSHNPEIPEKQFALLQVELRTGKLLTLLGERFSGKGDCFLFFDNFESAACHAKEIVHSNPEIECVIQDHRNCQVAVIRDESYVERVLAREPRTAVGRPSSWWKVWRQ
jgi:hypothetical protein